MATKQSIYFGVVAEKLLGDINSKTVNRALDRYAEILKDGHADRLFTGIEKEALRHLLQSGPCEPASAIRGTLLRRWEALVLDGKTDEWGLDDAAMTAKLRALTFLQELAVVHSVEQGHSGDQ